MKYFKFNNEVYAYEDDDLEDDLITSKHIPMTDIEIDEHINPSKYWSDEKKYELYLKSLGPITRRQFRRVLVINGYDLDVIRAKISEIPDSQTRQLTLIDWNDADTFERLDTSLIMMAEMMGMSDDQVNAMWEQALAL